MTNVIRRAHSRQQRFARALLTVAFALASGGGSAAAQGGNTGPQTPTFRGGIELVVLTVTVQQPKGQFVDSLGQDRFRVYEEGVPQKIAFFGGEEIPIDLMLVLDASGSMADTLRAARHAGQTLVRALRPGDRAAVVTFGRRATLKQPFTDDTEALVRALDDTQPAGDTALYDALNVALSEFDTPQVGGGLRRRALILLSDGEDTSSMSSYEDVIARARRTGVSIYTISMPATAPIDPRSRELRQRGQSAFEMRALATETGARAFTLAVPQDLHGTYASIAAELGHQYCLAYVPAHVHPRGQFTRVNVAVDYPDAVVRTRSGYVSAGAAP